eukprot:10393820-Ditylum_brightwellii.AAC.1
MAFCENNVCKEVQENITKTSKSWKDTLYSLYPFLFNVELDKAHRYILVQYSEEKRIIVTDTGGKKIETDNTILDDSINYSENFMSMKTKTKLPAKSQQAKRHGSGTG